MWLLKRVAITRNEENKIVVDESKPAFEIACTDGVMHPANTSKTLEENVKDLRRVASASWGLPVTHAWVDSGDEEAEIFIIWRKRDAPLPNGLAGANLSHS